MRYAQIRDIDISNGLGIGIALFVQGCHFHCKNCFNKSTWDFNGGKEWTKNIEIEFINLLDRDYIKRVSILGGEPLADENLLDIYNLIKNLQNKNKKIWLYTGYNFDYILNAKNNINDSNDTLRYKIIKNIDVLVDGKYIEELNDINYKFAGSTNQRVIDVQKTLINNKIILLGDLK